MSAVAWVLVDHAAIYDYDVSYVGPARCSCGYEVQGTNEDRLEDHARHAAEHLQPLIRQAQADAVTEVARAWQINGWADVLLPAPTPPAVPAIAYAQRVTDWLRDHADHLRGGQ